MDVLVPEAVVKLLMDKVGLTYKQVSYSLTSEYQFHDVVYRQMRWCNCYHIKVV